MLHIKQIQSDKHSHTTENVLICIYIYDWNTTEQQERHMKFLIS